MICALKVPEEAAPLFEGWQGTMIWSCLQGVMGTVYADSPKRPVSAMAVLGDFCFLAGAPRKEFILSECTYGKEGFMIMVPRDWAWGDMIEEVLGNEAKKTVRYAIKKEPDVFDREKLRAFAETVPVGCELQMMDEELFRFCGETKWCKDCEAATGASSYCGYLGGIEIEIDTRSDYRRRGFACICGAKLILECLKRGLYPSWDAQNKQSVALAEKLGYHFDHEYTVYEAVRETL